MDNKDMDNFEQFEEDTKLELIRLHDQSDDSKTKKIIDTISEELEKWFKEMKEFLQTHKDNEKVQEIIENMKEETSKIIAKVKDTATDIKDDDKVKDFMDSTGEALQKAKDKINDSETYHKVKDSVKATIHTIKNDENIKEGVKKAKTTTLHFAKSALSKIEKALEKDEDDIVVHSIKKEDDEA